MPDVVEILVTAKNLTGAAFKEAVVGAEGMKSSVSNLSKASTLAGAAVVGFVGESIKMAADFDAKMTMISTQAGVSKEKIAGLSRGVLDLAGQVGFSPDSLAESLYHVESNAESMGITSSQALDLVRTAAEGAAIGHAKLVDVTNALTAAVASGIPGVQNFQQAMGTLNATVGVGDMTMQDLASAMGSGMVATVKGFGLNITDVGAALAVFGDNNIRGAAAGTQLRMSVQALASPVASASAALKTLGLTHQTLADDMQRGGLKLALEDLDERMRKAGITADQQGEIITQAFGRKAGAGLNVLLSQMDRLESKYPALEAASHNFGQSWADTQKTFSQQMKEMDAGLQALMITFGEKLIPVVQKVTTFFLTHRDTTLKLAEATGALVLALAGFNVLSKVVAAFQGLATVIGTVNASMLAFKARVVEAQIASGAAGGSISALGAAFSELSVGSKLTIAAAGIALLVLTVAKLSDIGRIAPPNIDRMTQSLAELGTSGKVSGELSAQLGDNLKKLGSTVDSLSGKSSGLAKRFDALPGRDQLRNFSAEKEQIDAVDKSLAALVQGGHAELAAAAVKKLDDAMVAQGKNPGELDKRLQKYGDALRAVDAADSLTAASMGDLGKTAVSVSKQLDQQDSSAQGLKDAIVDLNQVNRSAIDAMAGFEGAIADAGKAFDKNGASLHMVNGQLDLTTEAARGNEKALSDLAAKTDDAALAALKNNEGQKAANDIYERGRQQLIKNAMQMGLNTDDAKQLADQILSTPDKTAQLRGDLSDLQQKLAAANDALNHMPPSQTVALLAEKQSILRDIEQVQSEIDHMHGTTLDITYVPHMGSSQMTANQAHGGIIGAMGHAAEGGPRSNLTWVGEMGPELVRLPFGSTVFPAGQSRQMAQSAAAAGPARVQIEWVGGQAGDEFMAWLRKNIRIRGGNVQTVLGQ